MNTPIRGVKTGSAGEWGRKKTASMYAVFEFLIFMEAANR